MLELDLQEDLQLNTRTIDIIAKRTQRGIIEIMQPHGMHLLLSYSVAKNY